MSAVNTIRARLIKGPAATDGSKFQIEGSNSYPIFSGIGLVLQVGFFESDGKTLIEDCSEIVALQHTVTRAGGTYLTRTVAGPLPIVTAAQWTAGTHQHAEFVFSDTETSITPAANYQCLIYGDSNVRAAALDFAFSRPMTVLDAGIPAAIVNPENAATLLAQLTAYIEAQVGDVIRRTNPAGATLTLKSPNGLHQMMLGIDDDGNPIDYRF